MTKPSPDAPKTRIVPKYKGIAENAQKEIAGLNSLLAEVRTQLANARSVSETWRNTAEFCRKAMWGSYAVAAVELVVILWLVFGR